QDRRPPYARLRQALRHDGRGRRTAGGIGMRYARMSYVGPPCNGSHPSPAKGLTMRHDDPSDPLRIEIDTHECDLAPEQVAMMQTDLDTLTKAVEKFPKPSLHVYVERNARTNEYVVKTSLMLGTRTLVASDHGPVVHAAYEKCVRILMD